MHILSLDNLDDLNDKQLWALAADMQNEPDIRQAAMERWLYPDESGEGDIDEERRWQVFTRRAEKLERDEVDEAETEDYGDDEGIYFDGEGRLIVAHNGQQYLVEMPGDRGMM